MARLRIARQAWTDIDEVMTYTQERFGASKRLEYEGQPGRRARHVLFYRVGTEEIVEAIRFLHDSMDFDRHL